ncbi:MAG TPA: ATP-binding protein [Vicinamibacterales bacterium]|jgi:signal transduction histidine kinase|nr:ATP-binding protein [Vicinamibacterales bacterium]
MPQRSDVRPRRRPAAPSTGPAVKAARQPMADARVRPEDRFFRHIVSSMRNGVIAFRRDGTLALMNADGYRIFGLTPSPDDVGRPFADVLATCPEIIRVLSGAFELSHLPNRAELRLKELDRVIGYTLSQVKDDDGSPIGAVLFFKDLTQVEQLEERERLRDRLASLGEMAAGIAHELKNPLAGIEVMAGLLRRQVPDSKDAQSLLADILSEAKLANAIVVEMLEFVRPVRLQVERTDLDEVLQQSITMAEAKVARREVIVKTSIEPGLPMIEGDHHQLSQVFTNLIANAFEALDGRGAITISMATAAIEADPAFAGIHPPAPAVLVEVADDGPGVPANLTDRIFNPFFTTKVTGTGLGLAIVRKIVDAHDGRIDVHSTPDTGTRFRVTLPVSSASGWFK